MATAGRILIMPKGAYDASVTYQILDLVSYNGTSWLAKKTNVGITPSEENSEYWHNMFDLEIANNLTTEAAGKALDAAQGKKLADMFTNLIKIATLESVEIASLAAQEGTEVSFEFPVISGYTQMMLIYRSNDTSEAIVPYTATQIYGGSGTVKLGVTNAGQAAVTAFKCTAYGIYIKKLE